MENLPTVLPITALTAGILGVLSIALSVNVVRNRRRSRKSLGIESGDDALLVAGRVFGNFCEYVPLAILLLIIAELNRAPEWALWVIAASIVVGRGVHAFGLAPNKTTIQRVIGMSLTWISIGTGTVVALVQATG